MSFSSGLADVGTCYTVAARGMRGVLPCSPGTINAGAHNTVDAQRHVGGALPYLSGMGVNGAHNTVGENIGAYNTA